MNKNYETALKAAIEAGVAILKIYENEDIGLETKEDKSPLTAADMASNEVINSYLRETDYPIISEENNKALDIE